MPDRMLFMAGPCVIESMDCLETIAKRMLDVTTKLNLDYYFKASWDKANRTAADKYRGPGLEKGLQMLSDIKEKYGVRIITDFHEPWQAKEVAQVADMIQVPAFLSRQTDMIKAAAQTGLPVQIKKAQFMTPDDMYNVAGKMLYYGNDQIYLCDRGTCFGYHNLVVDMTGLAKMKTFGHKVVFDATHSVQLPGTGINNSTLGNRAYVKELAMAACALGIDGLFMEVHPNPDEALCDSACMLQLDDVESVLNKCIQIREIALRDIC